MITIRANGKGRFFIVGIYEILSLLFDFTFAAWESDGGERTEIDKEGKGKDIK